MVWVYGVCVVYGEKEKRRNGGEGREKGAGRGMRRRTRRKEAVGVESEKVADGG